MVGGWCPRKEWLRNPPKEFIKRMDKRMHVNVSRANDDKDEKIGYLEYDRVDSLLTRMMLMLMCMCMLQAEANYKEHKFVELHRFFPF